MILYFDNYMTDTPLFKYIYDDLVDLRKRSKIYSMPSKLDVTKYTLASYAIYPWSGVLIKYEFEIKSQGEEFEAFARKLFPKAVIIGERSDSQKKYQDAYRMLEKMGGEWVFYAGNNDHPFVLADTEIIGKCLAKADELLLANEFVCIWYSHIHEGAGMLSNKYFKLCLPEVSKDKEIIDEDEDVLVCRNTGGGDFNSILIANMGLFKHWFFSKDMGNERIRRVDDLRGKMTTPGQVMICPKRHICDHFDGYSTISSKMGVDMNSVVPPLFIPPGFFENGIKIAFGYPEYREGWVNINPLKKKYSFESKDGTDMRIGIRDLPLFWKGRISKIDINPKIDYEKAEALGHRNMVKMCYPWPDSALAYYFAKYVGAPAFRMKKVVMRTRDYFKDPDYLRDTKDEGSGPVRLYKNAVFAIVKIVKPKGNAK